MKKIIYCFILIIMLCGCNKNNESVQNTTKEEKETTTTKVIEEKYEDNNPINLGLYLYTNSSTNRKLINTYEANWDLNNVLCSLEVYYTNQDEIPGTNQKSLWQEYYNNYENIDTYKIGYNISFKLADGTNFSKNILSPTDINEVYDYMQIYLYDDINTTSSWYDHLDETEYTENSILSSIKLVGSTKSSEITSDITLTVFTYDSDNFDKNNNYIGKSKFTTILKRI